MDLTTCLLRLRIAESPGSVPRWGVYPGSRALVHDPLVPLAVPTLFRRRDSYKQ